MTAVIIILVVIVVLFLSSTTKYQSRKQELESAISLIERKMKSTPQFNAIHYYNLGVSWQERFAFDKARTLYKKSHDLLMTDSTAISNSDKLTLLNRIESNMEFCKGKDDKTDSSTYFAYSDRFAAARSVGLFKPELYN
jgi:hypothetical protein